MPGPARFRACYPQDAAPTIIAPKKDDIEGMDFFDVVLPYRDRIVVVGNPPFGKNASLAIRFFNGRRSPRGDHRIHRAGVVPEAFDQKKLHPHFHLRREWPIPDQAFLFDGVPKTVPTVFQIWEWSPEPRLIPVLPTTHDDFEFTTKEKAHFALQRVGANVEFIHCDFTRGKGSTYFIRAKKPFVKDNPARDRLQAGLLENHGQP